VKSTPAKRKAVGKASPDSSPENVRSSHPEDRQNQIATAAYYSAEARGFAPGQALDDWLDAEAEFDQREGG